MFKAIMGFSEGGGGAYNQTPPWERYGQFLK